MYEKLEEIFLNDKVFAGAALCSAIGFVLHAECALMPAFSDFAAAMNYLLRGGCILAMLISYRRHSKNVMKGMMGALLALALSGAFNAASTVTAFRTFLSWVCILSTGALFVNHFLINSSRYSSRRNVQLNQIFVLAVIAADICLFFLLLFRAGTALERIDALLFLISEVPFAAAVICIETRLDLYRTEREAAGWTEESGYPADYDRARNYISQLEEAANTDAESTAVQSKQQ